MPDLMGHYGPTVLRTLPVVVIVAAISFQATGLYRSIARYASVDTLIAVARAATVAVALAALAIFVGWRAERVPRSVFLIQWMLLLLVLGGLRVLPRVRRYRGMRLRPARRDRVPVLVYGAGDAGELIARDIIARGDRSDYWVVGFIDDDPAKQGRTLQGRPVLGGGADLETVVAQTGAREILLAIPSASGPETRRIVERCRALPGLQVKTLPALADLIAGRVTVQELHEVRIEDLLKRAPRDLEPERVRAFLHDRTVLVTGAGGSIGSELCRQIARADPAALVLFEQSEYNLYAIDQELGDRHPDLRRRAVLGDASHRSSIEPVVLDARPDIIFHAAAYKHVPLLETNPCEGVLNNVLGVLNAAGAADAAGTETFVFISTDKAVEPVSVMGAAKRVGELYVQALAARSETRLNVVRFGNVLGSSGSVIPRFTDQIRRGGPVTVTHPDATRYFMLTSEAVALVMQAASLGRSGEIFVLDMGEPVRIADLARELAALLGAGGVEIVYTGLRPGEKLAEKLVVEPAHDRATDYESILLEGLSPAIEWDPLQAGLSTLIEVARAGDAEATLDALAALVPEYRNSYLSRTARSTGSASAHAHPA